MRTTTSAALIAALVACGGSNGSGANAIAPKDYGVTAAKAVCAALATCCAARAFAYDDTCVAQMTPYFQQPIDVALASGHATYDAQGADACVRARAAREAECADDVALAPASPIACAAVVGDRAPGDPCAVDGECAPAEGAIAACVDAATVGLSGERVCAVTRAGAPLGAACDQRAPVRDACDASAGACARDGICRAYLNDGDDCASVASCRPGSYCDPQIGACVKAAELGQLCHTRRYCDTTQPLQCDSATSQCVAATVRADGDACADGACPVGQACVSNVCLTDGAQHIHDVSPRSCAFGPLNVGRELDGKR